MNAEKENTFRALRDEELLVTSKWCRFGIHRWTKWRANTCESSITYRFGNLGRYYVFNRKCVHCNYIDQSRRWMQEQRHECSNK